MKSVPFLICHRGGLGDFVLTWPALRCLRNVLPGKRFLGVGRAEYMRLAVHLGFVDAFLDAESARMLDFFAGKGLPPEVGSPEGAVLWLQEGEGAAGLLRSSASLPVVTVPPFPSKTIHVARYHCLAIREHFPLVVPRDLSHCFPHRKKEGRYALVHPGSGSRRKNYSTPFYLAVAEELRQAGYGDVRFVIGPAEDGAALKPRAGERVEKPRTASDLADLIEGAALLVGNDSGVSHLSGALGVPTIALYKSTDPDVWGVVGKEVRNLPVASAKSALIRVRRCLQQWHGRSRRA